MPCLHPAFLRDRHIRLPSREKPSPSDPSAPPSSRKRITRTVLRRFRQFRTRIVSRKRVAPVPAYNKPYVPRYAASSHMATTGQIPRTERFDVMEKCPESP
ncbi:MAG: hypothetical protein M1817_002510 [Caeruleum heppii]|nr:MAG: hypothetical protein M1817_002510 [Caeruleum heppii]